MLFQKDLKSLQLNSNPVFIRSFSNQGELVRKNLV